MEYPKSYLNWIEYLIKKKLYGSWIKDVVTYAESDIDQKREFEKRRYEPVYDGGWTVSFSYSFTRLSENQKSYYIGNKEKVNEFIQLFSHSDGVIKSCISSLTFSLGSMSFRYKTSGIHWTKVYKEYSDRHNPKLSKGLSRKLSRTTNKDMWAYGYKEKVEQPWYSKSYEKYNKKAWRK